MPQSVLDHNVRGNIKHCMINTNLMLTDQRNVLVSTMLLGLYKYENKLQGKVKQQIEN